MTKTLRVDEEAEEEIAYAMDRYEGERVGLAQALAGEPEAIDLMTAEGKRRLLDFWLTTPEEDYQVTPTADGEALVAYLLALRKAEVPLPEAKE